MPSVDGIVAILDPSASADDQAQVLQTIVDNDGEVFLGLGETAAVVTGGQVVNDALEQLVGTGLLGLASSSQEIPVDADADTTELVQAWFASQDPAVIAAKDDPAREGPSGDQLSGCGQSLVLP